MSNEKQLTFLCIASYEKGSDFLRQAKQLGCRVILLTSQSLENANWPHDSIDEIFYIPDENKEWNMDDVTYAVSFLARTEQIDRIIALDDYDVEKAARLREHLRVPGMGDTTARYFRDKLAMRTRAKEIGILVPEFVHILNYDRIREFMSSVPAPWILKPRMHAGAIGMKKIFNEEELWQTLDDLGDEQSFYLMEKFVPGEIFHVDSIVYRNIVSFSVVSKYGLPPMEVAHAGRIFSSRTVERNSVDDKSLKLMNKQVLHAMGLKMGVSHSEFIKAKEDGRYYFLETSARVGGANLHELVKAATGINLWEEWAKIEVLKGEEPYEVPSEIPQSAGILLSLARQEWPDMEKYDDPEIVWRLDKKNHAGLVVASSSQKRVEELIIDYTKRFYDDFFATQPMQDKPTS
ncbi:MAG: ATP-grasp domain-containing protein [Melioribacteraceae bacterium]|nr:ATP-grasp domain-containing protein [Melioribacteraceae bacterium]MCF8354423.1 ATP-grasp domain-containing protein [Melioribacteraceae bacterium]MCF8394033.1 ATP-grasp domain-containing protein [Melioribacteraceae bacterium]MCF8419799.1 ATP-grasp domain-containing protein [Melioribacteraceae bacterium]